MGDSRSVKMAHVLAILANAVYLASSSELCGSHSEETSLLALRDARGFQGESWWTHSIVNTDGRTVCTWV